MSARDLHPIADAILRGDHDDEIDYIQQACSARLKRRFRKGMHVKVAEGRMMGAVGLVMKVNPKRVSVDLGEDGQWNIPPSWLQVLDKPASSGLTKVELSELDGLR